MTASVDADQDRSARFAGSASWFAGQFRILERLLADGEWLLAAVPARYLTETRSIQLEETAKVALYSAVTHSVVAATFVLFFWGTTHRIYVMCLFVAVTVPSMCAITIAILHKHRLASTHAVDRGRKIAATIAFFVGAAWGTMPIALFPTSNSDHQLMVVGTTIGVIADVYVLGPIFPVCLAFVLPVVVGGFIGLTISGQSSAYPLAVLLLVYTTFVVFSCKGLSRLSVQRIADRVQVSDQSDTIGLLLRDFEENTSDWLWEMDAGSTLSHVSRRAAQAAGLPPDLKNASLEMLFRSRAPLENLSDSARSVVDAIAQRRAFTDRLVEIKTANSSIWWRLTGKPVVDKQGLFVGYRGVGSDVTDARRTEARIAYMANFDSLTGLANRGLFMSKADGESQEDDGADLPRVLLYLDLDGFKAVNDSLGHASGDELLKQVAARLIAMTPPEATVSRLGGDEFAIMYRPLSRRHAEHLARALIDGISEPFIVDGSRAEVGVSIGLAFAPEDASDTDNLLIKADLALYRAKAEGKGRYRAFHKDYETEQTERRHLEADLRLALARREFELLYQPIVSFADGRIPCFEALIRWDSPTRGRVSPVVFIPVAESIGLIVEIGRWVLLQACREARQWPENSRVAVNISPLHFRAADFVTDVVLALDLSGLPPERLEIEITEGVFLDNCVTAIDNLHALRRRGIRIAIDDFGTGFSSLNYLVRFPVDKIKIDRSFVQDLSRKENLAIVETILSLAQKLAIDTTAEGVETSDQAHALRDLSCTTMQGYLMSPPRHRGEIADLYAAIARRFADLFLAEPVSPRFDDTRRLESLTGV